VVTHVLHDDVDVHVAGVDCGIERRVLRGRVTHVVELAVHDRSARIVVARGPAERSAREQRKRHRGRSDSIPSHVRILRHR
jgi:hypothetical protein